MPSSRYDKCRACSFVRTSSRGLITLTVPTAGTREEGSVYRSQRQPAQSLGALNVPPTPRLAEVGAGSPDWAPAQVGSKGGGKPRAVLTAGQCTSHHGCVEIRGQGLTTQEGLELVVGGEVDGSGRHSHHPRGVNRLAKTPQSSQTSQASPAPPSQPTGE